MVEEGEKKFGTAGHLKEGSYVLIEGCVCQVKSVEKSKPGKHGAAKVRITAIDVFSSQKKNLLKSTDADVEIPIIKKGSGQVVAVMGDIVQVMDMMDYNTFDSPKPSDVQGLASGAEVEYIKFGANVKIVRKK
ncbi:MAG: translation initiation factor IF-5A [Candidatus Diapherotrites archaeon]